MFVELLLHFFLAPADFFLMMLLFSPHILVSVMLVNHSPVSLCPFYNNTNNFTAHKFCDVFVYPAACILRVSNVAESCEEMD